MSHTSLITLEPGDSFFFPGHRPFNQDDPGLGEAETRFPPPPHSLAGAVRYAIARKLGWRHGDWRRHRTADGIDLGVELGSGPFDAGRLGFGPPLILDQDAPLYPVPRLLAGRLDRWGGLVELALVRPGEAMILSDAGALRLPEITADRPAGFQPLDGWWMTKNALKKVLDGKLPARELVSPAGELMRTRPRVGLATDYAGHKARDGMLYAAAHGAFRPTDNPRRFACRLVLTDESGLGPMHLPQGALIPLGSHGRAATIDKATDAAPPNALLQDKKRGWVRFSVSLISPGWLAGGPVPEALEDLGTVVSASHGRPVILGAWDRDDPARRHYQRLYPAGSTWFLEARGAEQVQQAKNLGTRLAAAGKGIGEHQPIGFGAAVIGIW